MSQLVAAFGSSHSAMLNAELEHWLATFDHVDCKVPVIDEAGNPSSYAAALIAARPRVEALMAPAAIRDRFAATMAAIDHLTRAIKEARLDVLIVLGDDQREVFKDAMRPAIGIYYGATIRNGAAPAEKPGEDWYRRAQYRRMEEGRDVDYPVDAALGRALIEGLSARGFDITAVQDLPAGQSEGHAFSFLHRRYLRGSATRMVPIFLNTYYPPNQPTPRRCQALGVAIGELVEAYPENLRVGLIASGGLSHYRVDEELDRSVIAALQRGDQAFLAALEPRFLQSGTSEIRNWICVAAAAQKLGFSWHAYVAGYRSSGLTGVGLCFAQWS
jgi:3-O-methylgallate 3,4-dioxygenase